jgi:hypothetical protein
MAVSQSKMPPQKGERLFHGIGVTLGFGAHGDFLNKKIAGKSMPYGSRRYSTAPYCVNNEG